MAYPLLDEVDRRLIAALQVNGRASPEHLAEALDLPPRTVTRLLAALRIHAQAHQWRLPSLSTQVREALGEAVRPDCFVPPAADEAEVRIRAVLETDGRASAAVIAARSGVPATTVRRRLSALREAGTLPTSVLVDPARLGLPVDANLILTVPPGRLDAVARALAGHPAVHGVLATTGVANLDVAVWLRDLDDLYEFITGDLAGLDVSAVETVLVGRAVKRPGMPGDVSR